MFQNSLLVIGLLDIPEKTYGLAFTKYAVKKLRELLPAIANQLKCEDVDCSHPTSSERGKKSCIIIKFVRRDIRNLVFYQKRDLKNLSHRVTIVEHLNGRNLWFLSQVRKAVGFRNAWTSQCVVYALLGQDKVAVTSYRGLSYVESEAVKYYRRPISSNQSASSQPLPNNSDSQSPLPKEQSGLPNHRVASLPDRNEVIEAVSKISSASSTTSSSTVPPHVETDRPAAAAESYFIPL